MSKKSDYLRYIEYEMNLEALRLKRRERLNIKGKRSLSDFAGQRHIQHIFERACKKFHGDVSLWLEYADYARRVGSHKVAGRAFARAIQFHPRNPVVWLAAAKWEWEDNANVTAARALLQRALRMNSDAKDLWIEYFKLECFFLIKIAERNRVLGIEESSKEETDEPKQDGVDMSEIPEARENNGVREIDHMPNTLGFMEGAIPIAVFKNAIQLNGADLKFRIEFIALIDSLHLKYPSIEKACLSMLNVIYESIERDFPEDPLASETACERMVRGVKIASAEYPLQLKECLKSFNSMFEFSKNWESVRGRAELVELHLDFILRVKSQCHTEDVDESLRLFISQYITHLSKVCLTEQILSERIVEILLEHAETDKSDFISKAVTLLTHSLTIWKLYFEHNPLDRTRIEDAKSNLSLDDRVSLSLFLVNNVQTEDLIKQQEYADTMELINIHDLSTDAAFDFFKSYFMWIRERDGQDKFRTTYLLHAQSKHRSLEYFKLILDLESESELSAKNVQWLRQIYELAVKSNGSSVEAWLLLAGFELKYDLERALQVYHRAVASKSLDDEDRAEFCSKYDALNK